MILTVILATLNLTPTPALEAGKAAQTQIQQCSLVQKPAETTVSGWAAMEAWRKGDSTTAIAGLESWLNHLEKLEHPPQMEMAMSKWALAALLRDQGQHARAAVCRAQAHEHAQSQAVN